MKIPADLDRLMSGIAESDSIAARMEFGERHPDLLPELDRRIEAARLAREEGKAVALPHPGLEIRRESRPLPTWGWILGGTVVGGLIAAAAWLRVPPAPEAVLSPPSPRRASAPISAPSSTAPSDIPPTATSPSVTVPEPTGLQEGPAGTPAPSSEKPQGIRLARTSLHAALGLIAEAGSLRIRIDPAVPDPEVEASFENQTPRAMLDTLGKVYGFGVLEEGPGSLLITPLPEPSGGDEEGGETSP